jgi:hypothetical protein
MRVGISISESENVENFGFSTAEINRTVIRLVSAVLGQGASLCFGHDWRDDGVMESVHAYAQRYQDPAHDRDVPLLNVLPWPDKPKLSTMQRQRLRATLRVELPDYVKALERAIVVMSKAPSPQHAIGALQTR